MTKRERAKLIEAYTNVQHSLMALIDDCPVEHWADAALDGWVTTIGEQLVEARCLLGGMLKDDVPPVDINGHVVKPGDKDVMW